MNGETFSGPSIPPRVLLVVPFGTFTVHHQLDAVLGTALRLRGSEVLAVGCDRIFKTCDVLSWSGANTERDCMTCAGTGAAFMAQFGMPYTLLGKALVPDDFAEAQAWADSVNPEEYSTAMYRDVPIGDWITSSVHSHFRITQAGLKEPQVRLVHKGYLVTGLLAFRAFSRIMEAYRPQAAVVFNGRLAVYRVAFETARRLNINVLSHERGWVDDSFMLFDNQVMVSPKPLVETPRQWKDIALTGDELRFVKQYYDNRERGKDINFTPFVNYTTDYASVRHSLNIPDGVKIVTVMTSSEFELCYIHEWKTFVSQLELIERLIEVFKNRKEYLVIRHHPYIGGMDESPPDRYFMTRVLAQARALPPNVRIITPSEKLSSYALLRCASAAITPFSTTAVEAVARGVPSASFEASPYRDIQRVCITDASPQALHALVDTLLDERPQSAAEELRRVYRFQNVLTRKLSVRFKSFGIKNTFSVDLRFTSAEDLKPGGGDAALDQVCDFMLGRGALHPAPTDADRARGSAEEDAFFANEIASNRDIHNRVKEQSPIYRKSRPAPAIALVNLPRPGAHPDYREAALRIARYRNVLNCDLSALSEGEALLAGLRRALEELDASYFAFTMNGCMLDESFLSNGVYAFVDDSASSLAALRYGGWVLDGEANVVDQIFTKQKPAVMYKEALALMPAFADWPALLPFHAMRREFFESLIGDLGRCAPAQRAERLFELLSAKEVKRLEYHGLGMARA
jgi:hypothetical protein